MKGNNFSLLRDNTYGLGALCYLNYKVRSFSRSVFPCCPFRFCQSVALKFNTAMKEISIDRQNG